MPSARQLRDDAQQIWQAGVDAVRPELLLAREIEVSGQALTIGDWTTDLRRAQRIVVVGGGKAGAGMARGLEAALGDKLLSEKQVTGWLNVPEGTVQPTQAIHLHPGRPAGINEPRPAGVEGTRHILGLVEGLNPNDLCICLLSGGGSALLAAPKAGVSLEDKIAITRLLSGAGANIEQLNRVRRQLSDIKGGGLARACRAGQMVTVVISDVLGDPLDIIASGPTFESDDTAADALAVLAEFDLLTHPKAERVVEFLRRKQTTGEPKAADPLEVPSPNVHIVLANNATAVDAAGMEAERRGYNHAMLCATESEGAAEDVGHHLADMALQMRDRPGPNCLITGGEPVVQLAPPETRGKGGRNQQLVLAAMQKLNDCHGIALLSGGTDGEDGPTNAAGAWVDEAVSGRAAAQGLDIASYLSRNDAYTFFQQAGGLLQTGATGTNVCDIRVVVVDQSTKS